MVSALAILQNCAEIPSLLELLWEIKIDQVLLPYMSSPLPQVCISALILLGLLSVSADKAIFSLDDEMAALLSNKITDALHDSTLSTDLSYMQVSAEGLLKSANGLVLDVANAANFLKNENILQSFFCYLNGTNVDVQLNTAIMNCFWTLATHSTIRKQFLDEPKVLEAIQHLIDTSSSAKCALLKCQGLDLNEGKVMPEFTLQTWKRCIVAHKVRSSLISSFSRDRFSQIPCLLLPGGGAMLELLMLAKFTG